MSKYLGAQKTARTPKHHQNSLNTFRNNHLRNDVDGHSEIISVNESRAMENCKILLQRRMQ